MALGCVLPSSAALVATCFGSPAFVRVMGMIYVGIVVASVVSVQFTGRVYDSTGSYRVAFECFLAISMLCAVAALLVRAPQSVRADRSQAADLSATDAENIVASGSPR
jgi:MFS family permease